MSLSTSPNSLRPPENPLSAAAPLSEFAEKLTGRLNKSYCGTDRKEFTVRIVEPSPNDKKFIQDCLGFWQIVHGRDLRLVSLQQKTTNSFTLFETAPKAKFTLLSITGKGEKMNESFFPINSCVSDLRSIVNDIKSLKELGRAFPEDEKKLEKIAFKEYQEKKELQGNFSTYGNLNDFVRIFKNALIQHDPECSWNVQLGTNPPKDKNKYRFITKGDGFFAIEQKTDHNFHVYGKPLPQLDSLQLNPEQEEKGLGLNISIKPEGNESFEGVACLFSYRNRPVTVDLKDFMRYLFKEPEESKK